MGRAFESRQGHFSFNLSPQPRYLPPKEQLPDKKRPEKSAVRLSELATLKINEIDYDENYFKVTDKGSKERFVPFGRRVAKNLIAYCGLNCAVCFSYKMTVSEAAKALRRELRTAKLKEAWKEIPFLNEYEPFKKSLDGLAMLRCPKVCREGGGNPWYKIRKCAHKKETSGCWECEDLESCDKLNERCVKNIQKIEKVGLEKFVATGSR